MSWIGIWGILNLSLAGLWCLAVLSADVRIRRMEIIGIVSFSSALTLSAWLISLGRW